MNAGNSALSEVRGTLTYNEFEGGFWSIEPDPAGHAIVLPGWQPAAPMDHGSRVRARVRMREEQFGILMAGPMADVEHIELSDG